MTKRALLVLRSLLSLAPLVVAPLSLACSPSHPADPVDAGVEASDDGGEASWQVVLQHLDGTLLSIWGTSPTDVYAVGGPRGNAGFKALVLHFDGTQWTRLDPGNTDTYWWVHGSNPPNGPNGRDVWMTGENGRITHWDGATFKDYPSGTTATIFGVWAASPTDAWAVGGTPEGGTGKPNDVLLHWDGASWSPSALPQALGRTYFKVWGSSADDVYAVGEAGTIWHRTKGAWKLESDPPVAHGNLTTVFGCSPTEVYAVGSRDVLRSDGTSWKVDLDPSKILNDVNGVSCGKPGEVVVVGFGGLKQRKVAGAWQDDFGTKPYADLHGSWVDAAGGLWGVGGDFLSNPRPNATRDGVIAHFGKVPIPTKLAP